MTISATPPPGATDWVRYAQEVQKQQLRQLAQQGQLASQISHLVHMLQCERGTSNIWLCSAGRLYEPEYRACRALVDEQYRALLTLLAASYAQVGSALCQRIAAAVWSLEQLPPLRRRVLAGDVPADEATRDYGRTIRQLLGIIPQLSDSIDDPLVSGRMVALYSLMQGKELVGQERALGAQGFTRGVFSDELRQRLVDRIEAQQPCFDSFRLLAPGDMGKAFLEQGLPGREIEQLRRIACTRTPAADNGTSALHWFILQTQRLEQLRGLEEMLIADLMLTVDRLLTREHAPEPAPGEDETMLPAHLDKQLLPLVREQARELEQLTAELASVRDTLAARKIIDKAKSLLMEHRQLSEEQAWQALRKMAMDQNQRMADIAQALISVAAVWQRPPAP